MDDTNDVLVGAGERATLEVWVEAPDEGPGQSARRGLLVSALLCALFFASGVSALIFETLWFHEAGLAFGNSVWASSLVLAGFMGGLALGSALAAHWGDRLDNPIRAYAIAELAIAGSGIGLVVLFPVLGVLLAPALSPLLDHPWILNPLRLLGAFILFVIPSTAMGVTLPVLTKALTSADPNFGRVLGRLYGWNTLGAVVGVVLGEVYLIRAWGLVGTALIAGTVNIGAAVGAMWLSTQSRPRPAPAYAGRTALNWSGGRRWLAAAFLAGFCLLALEEVWFRFLELFVLGQSMAFAIMLGVVLAGIALGGLTAAQGLRRIPDAHRLAAPIAFAAGLLCVASYAAFPLVIKPFELSDITRTLDILRVGAPLMFPVSFLSGVLFTLLGAVLRRTMASETSTTGILTLANTAGAALGSLVGGFVLLPVLGMERSFFLIAILYGGIGTLLWHKSPVPVPRWIAYASAAGLLVSLTLFPFGSMGHRFLLIPVKKALRKLPASRSNVVAVREGLTETITYIEQVEMGKPAYYAMLTNAYAMSGTPSPARRYMKLYAYWPMAIHPNLKRALLICYGVGNTAKALTDSTSLERMDVVDISRDILELNDIVYPEKADHPLHDPRVHVHIEDGRYFLQMTEQRFDLITGEPPPPAVADVVNLYTREYFQLLRNRLADGGIVTYWLPLQSLTDGSSKAILRAFCDAFDDCSLWNGSGPNLMMVGTKNAKGPVSEEQFVRQWREPIVAAEMKRLGFERPEQLGALFIGDADYLHAFVGEAPALVDNFPKLIEVFPESQAEVDRLLRSFVDAHAAQERFRQSPLIKRLWPERLLTETLPYFEVQDMINGILYGASVSPVRAMQDVHRLLTQSSLRTPALWRLGSNSDLQRIVAQTPPTERADPRLQYHLGVKLILEGHYADAIEPLRRAEQFAPSRDAALWLRLYALGMSGQLPQAQHLAEERLAGPANDAALQAMWEWMQETFGISSPLSAPGHPHA